MSIKLYNVYFWWHCYLIITIIITVISIAPYLTDKGEHTALYKINNNV